MSIVQVFKAWIHFKLNVVLSRLFLRHTHTHTLTHSHTHTPTHGEIPAGSVEMSSTASAE